jgi:hypothetical protein
MLPQRQYEKSPKAYHRFALACLVLLCPSGAFAQVFDILNGSSFSNNGITIGVMPTERPDIIHHRPDADQLRVINTCMQVSGEFGEPFWVAPNDEAPEPIFEVVASRISGPGIFCLNRTDCLPAETRIFPLEASFTGGIAPMGPFSREYMKEYQYGYETNCLSEHDWRISIRRKQETFWCRASYPFETGSYEYSVSRYHPDVVDADFNLVNEDVRPPRAGIHTDYDDEDYHHSFPIEATVVVNDDQSEISTIRIQETMERADGTFTSRRTVRTCQDSSRCTYEGGPYSPDFTAVYFRASACDQAGNIVHVSKGKRFYVLDETNMMPTLEQAIANYDRRKAEWVNTAVAWHLNRAEGYDWGANYGETDGGYDVGMTVLRSIGFFTALEERRAGDSRYRAVPTNVPHVFENWACRIEAGNMGTIDSIWDAIFDKPTSWDFATKEMVAMLHHFKDSPHLLTDRAAECLLHEDHGELAKYAGPSEWADLLEITLGPNRPETENHVLMILATIYLTNQWIQENPRRWSADRLGDLFGWSASRFRRARREGFFETRNSALEQALLKVVARVLHDGFFETNASSYQAKSLAALLYLAAYAEAGPMETGARNAVDYAMAKFAFQSFEGNRMVPMRRNIKEANRLDHDADGTFFVAAALSGVRDQRLLCRPGIACSPVEGPGPASSRLAGMMALVTGYELPEPIHDYFLDKHQGYWARMQAQYNEYQQKEGRNRPNDGGTDDALYFASGSSTESWSDRYGCAYANGIEFTPEVYFATPRFLNSSGGAFNRYRVDDDRYEGSDSVTYLDVHTYDFLSKPQTLFVRSRTEYGSQASFGNLTDAADKVMLMAGSDQFWVERNNATYKTFAYGTYRSASGSCRDFPMEYPSRWDAYAVEEEFQVGQARFRFIDLSREELYGFYLVLAEVHKSWANDGVCRGFWEVVPYERFWTVDDLIDYVLDHNRQPYFGDESGPEGNYIYTMTTGESVELDHIHGRTAIPDSHYRNYRYGGSTHPIPRIWAVGADPSFEEPEEIADLLFGPDDNRPESVDARCAMPLLEVREVDDNYQFTGRTLAYAAGDGQLVISNPYLGQRLTLDSRDAYRPSRRLVAE